MSWLEHTVQMEMHHPVDKVWTAWADLPSMPRWMRWLQSVEVPADQPNISVWHLGANGFTFAWKSKIVKQIPLQLIQWEAIDGLPNRGAVRFYGRGDRTIVKLSVSYAIPTLIAELMDSLFLGRLVEDNLRKSLERFAVYLDERYRVPAVTSGS
ncbi:MAG: SRPBCC family protein [Pseudanabaenaceae cyanobacterium]